MNTDVDRQLRTSTGRLRRSGTLKGLGFLLGWGVVGWTVTSLTLRHFFPYLLVGNFAPPKVFWVSLHLGIYLMPIVLIFGGLPAAIQLMRGRPWKVAALVSFAICLIIWAVPTFIVVLGPSIWGWVW